MATLAPVDGSDTLTRESQFWPSASDAITEPLSKSIERLEESG